MNNTQQLIFAAVLTAFLSPTWAQEEHAGHTNPPSAEPSHSGHGTVHERMPQASPMPEHGAHGSEHGTQHGSANAADAPQTMQHESMPTMDHSSHGATASAMQPAEHEGHAMTQDAAASTELRDPHAYSGGYEFSQFPMRHVTAEHYFGMLLVDRLEAVRSDDATVAAYDLQASYGGAFDRAVLKAEGEADDGKLEEASTELLWGHALAPFWNSQLGIRHDSGEGPDRSWLAFGLQGLAPYWFEIDATAYLGEQGRGAVNLEAEYELLLTQKWVLQPRFETNLHTKEDPAHGIGAGLSDATLGLRLRYEIRREFAPYVGIEWAGRFGDTADYARTAALDTREMRAVAGLRFWF